MRNKQMTFKATQKVYWPSKLVYACERHARQLCKVGEMVGLHVPTEVYTGDEKCKKCVNESKLSFNFFNK